MSDQSNAEGHLLPEALRFYAEYDEAGRLFRGGGVIERVRTQELIARYAPAAPATVLDIGGGPGVHALWLARRGYAVHLLDAMPRHVEQARAASAHQPETPIASMQVGDARRLPFADASAEVVLLLGPLYHLVDEADRLLALQEARRVLRPGGLLLAAAISRFASLLDNLFHRPDVLLDPTEAALLLEDLAHGQHRNPAGQLVNFTTTHFHHPGELRAEISAAGFQHVATLAVEGPFWMALDSLSRWSEPQAQSQFLTFLRQIEQEPTLLGASAHLLAVARKD